MTRQVEKEGMDEVVIEMDELTRELEELRLEYQTFEVATPFGLLICCILFLHASVVHF